MSDTTDMMNEGILCCCCGVFLGPEIITQNGGVIIDGNKIVGQPGFPIMCEDCK